jgi:uncharacterized Zn-binding protein involved in type VI secretion
MPFICTKVDLCAGHDACPPRAFSTFSPTVFAEGLEVVAQGDVLHEHGCPAHAPHSAIVTAGCSTVLVGGKEIAVVGSPVSCPSGVLVTYRPTVTAGPIG